MATKLPPDNLPEDIFESTDSQVSAQKPQNPDISPPLEKPAAKSEQPKKATPEPLPKQPQGGVEQPHETVPLAPSFGTSATVEAPSPTDIKKRSEREKQKKSSSAFLKIILIVFIVGVVLIAAGASFYFFSSRVVPENSAQGTPVVIDTPEPPAPIISETLPEVIDTTAWQDYENKNAGLSFLYPEDFTLSRFDDVLGPPNASGTPQLVLRGQDGLQTISIWIDSQGIAQFLNPTAIINGNPLNAGIHYILDIDGIGLSVKNVRYFSSRSGVIQSDLDAITAYAPEQPGVWQYTILYKDTRGEEASENFMKTFINTITLRLDLDSDGLFADEEEALGTDPEVADTDGDGFSDGTEVYNGYNPLGEGLLGN